MPVSPGGFRSQRARNTPWLKCAATPTGSCSPPFFSLIPGAEKGSRGSRTPRPQIYSGRPGGCRPRRSSKRSKGLSGRRTHGKAIKGFRWGSARAMQGRMPLGDPGGVIGPGSRTSGKISISSQRMCEKMRLRAFPRSFSHEEPCRGYEPPPAVAPPAVPNGVPSVHCSGAHTFPSQQLHVMQA